MGYEKLFTPFKIGNMEVKNRIGMSPMGTNSAFVNGRKDAQEIDYFIERAKGGAGIIYILDSRKHDDEFLVTKLWNSLKY